MLVNWHSCTLTPSLFTPGLAPVTSATFSKAMVDVLEVIGSFAMRPLLFLQLVLLSKVIKVSQYSHTKVWAHVIG